jgi:O-antigen ligase
LKDFRLVGTLPVLVAVFFALAPPQVTQRFYSMFDLQDPTNRDRIAMMKEGVRMIAEDPLTGMGPNMVEHVYVRFRDTEAVERVNPHLHNVPMQIAAERGLPALGAWIWFVGSAIAGLLSLFRTRPHRFLAAAGLGAVAAMLAAGFFEHNFGDSEFLMLFLILITLPFAANVPDASEGPADRGALAT